MNNTLSNKFFLILLSALTVTLFFSCKKDDTKEPAPKSEYGTLYFHIHTMADTAEVKNYGAEYILADKGRRITMDMAQMYISNIELVKLDGSALPVTGKILFVKQGTMAYQVGSVPAGNYKSVRFYVGLDSATNSATPAASDILLHQPSMWFSPTPQPDGFVYINFSGTIDTAAAPNGANAMIPFNYKLGTSSAFTRITMPDQSFTVTPGQDQYIHLSADYAMLFMGVKLNKASNLNITTPSGNNTMLGNMMGNMSHMMFTYKR